MPADKSIKVPIYTEQFWDDIANTIRYITFTLRNPQAAQELKDGVKLEIERIVALPFDIIPKLFGINRNLNRLIGRHRLSPVNQRTSHHD